MRSLPFVAVAGLLAFTSACDQNQSGNTGATKLGDTSHPAERSSPLAPLEQACGGHGAMLAGASSIERIPYLQQVTTSSASFGWVTRAAAGQTIVVYKPDGEMMQAATPQADAVEVLFAGSAQMWTTLETLEPDTIYCYQVMQDGSPVSEKIGFRTAPTADSTRTIGILAFGDSGGGGSDQFALLDQMELVPYELMIHTGDFAYEDGTLGQIEDVGFAVYANLFAHFPFFPASGNHDYGTLQGLPFREAFKLPENGDREKWYSYDWGRIHFVALDTESSYEEQAQWLDNDLAATTLPWKIVYLHRPPYSSGNHGSDTSLRRELAPILERHHVQLLLSGHDHHFERTTPINGVHYVVTGGGGRGTYTVGASSFTAFSEAVIHYTYLESKPDELVLHAIDAEGVEFDSVVIPR
jgi:hypothetical protein